MTTGCSSLYLLRSSKTSGSRKLRRDHSSARLFCSGVPVSSNLLSVGSRFSSLTNRQLRFLILWPSSTIKYFHWKRWTQDKCFFYGSNHEANALINQGYRYKIMHKSTDYCSSPKNTISTIYISVFIPLAELESHL